VLTTDLAAAIDGLCAVEPAVLGDGESMVELHRQLERLAAVTTRAATGGRCCLHRGRPSRGSRRGIVKGLRDEFKAFALGGNMLDLALGFIIGTAFATVVDSLAGDVIISSSRRSPGSRTSPSSCSRSTAPRSATARSSP